MPPAIPAGPAAHPFHARPVVRAFRPTSRGVAGLFPGLVAVVLSGAAVRPLAAQEPGSATAPVATPAETRGTGRGPLDLSIGVRGGTLGYGAEVGKLVASHLGVRVAAYVFSYARQQGLEDVQYDASVKFRHATALVDLFPGRRGKFHLTGGVVAGTSEVTGRGVPQGNTFYLNDREYTSAEVGALTGAVRFPRVRPYGGLGWGTPAKNSGGIGFSTDFGVVYGAPTTVLTASNAGGNAQLRADLAAERADAQETLDQYAKFYPVVNFGLTYRF
jgi:hypothetical protein